MTKICLTVVIIITSLLYITQGNSLGKLIHESEYSNTERVKFIRKRQVTETNTKFKECTTPTVKKGLCIPSNMCNLPPIKDNIWNAVNYFCILDSVSIGICCSSQLDYNSKIPQIANNIPRSSNDEDDENIKLRSAQRGCGITTKQFPRITGGRPAQADEWPWMVALIRRGFPYVFCGGVLISDKHVLTAAHCTNNIEKELFVRLGEYDVRQLNETRSRDFRIGSVKQHIDFDPVSYENDIAIITLEKSTIFNSYIWPVCLPPYEENWRDWNAIIIGWGTQFFGGPYSNVLMEASIPIWDHAKCKNLYEVLNRVPDNIICAGDVKGRRDSCQGDSGGPLLVQLPNHRWIVVGIVSWGLRCGEEYPGIYTFVGKYIPWILENSIH